MSLLKAILVLSLTGSMLSTAHADIASNSLTQKSKTLQMQRSTASSVPTCYTYNSVPTYYEATNAIKLPWVDMSGDGTNARYCAILQDRDQDGRYELTSFDVTNFYSNQRGKVTFNETTGEADVPYIMWLAPDGSLPYTGSMILQQQSDGQFSIENLVLK